MSEPVPPIASQALLPVSFTLNHVGVTLVARPGARLLDVLRREGHTSGVKEGCGEGECGACTVLLDGQAVCACLVLAQSVEGQSVVTIEGLPAGHGGKPHPVQAALHKHVGAQCGFCSPGIVMSAAALLEHNPNPSEHDVKDALSGNLCRCTGYVRVISAVMEAAAQLRHSADNAAGTLAGPGGAA